MRKFKYALVLSLFSCMPLSAATITMSNGGSILDLHAIANNDSTLASGGIAAAGYFTTYTDAQVTNLSADLSNISALIADFTIIGSTTLDSDVPNAGVYSGDFTNVTIPNATKSGNYYYSFLGNAATLGESTEWLLWRHADTIAAQDTVTNPESHALNLGETGSALISGGTFTSEIDFDGPGGDDPFPVNAIRLAAIPEPSALLLSAFAALTVLRRKR